MLASDIVVASRAGTRFGQVEVTRGILPFGGATLRFPLVVGWGNAMRYILTGDLFDACRGAPARPRPGGRPDDGAEFDRGALELAERIAAQAPLAVQAALANAKRAVRDGDAAAEAELQPASSCGWSGSEDAAHRHGGLPDPQRGGGSVGRS